MANLRIETVQFIESRVGNVGLERFKSRLRQLQLFIVGEKLLEGFEILVQQKAIPVMNTKTRKGLSLPDVGQDG